MEKIPTHVSIIMDGNGRWAQSRGLERFEGHKEGIESVRAITEACVEMGVRYLSLFAFSEENWGRPTDEVGNLMKLMMSAIKAEYPTMMKNGVRFVVKGNRERLSATLNAAITGLEKATSGNDKLTMIIMMSYSGKWDILQAAKKLAAKGDIENATLDDLAGCLVTSEFPDPDLIIRTSGEMRLSNYMLWQAAYSEFVITDTLWPDFRKEQFRAALEEYSGRDRRYGKVK